MTDRFERYYVKKSKFTLLGGDYEVDTSVAQVYAYIWADTTDTFGSIDSWFLRPYGFTQMAARYEKYYVKAARCTLITAGYNVTKVQPLVLMVVDNRSTHSGSDINTCVGICKANGGKMVQMGACSRQRAENAHCAHEHKGHSSWWYWRRRQFGSGYH